MRIQYVKIKNLGPFRKVNLDLHDKDVIGVQARWKGNSRKSNQSGKSFLMEAIKWCLTGDSRAEKDIELIHHGEDAGEVIVCLTDGEKSHVIRRGKTIKNESVLEVGSQEKSKEAQETINKLIGFLPNEFDMTAYFEQEEINSFMKLTPAKKKEYIMRWLENHYWETPYTNAKRDLDALTKTLQELKNNQAYLEDEYESMSHTIESDIEEKEKMLSKVKEELVKLEKKLKKLEKSLKNDSIEDLEEKLEEAIKSKKMLERSLESYESTKAEIDENLKKIRKIKLIKPKYEESELYEKMANTRQKIQDLKNKLSSARELTGRCPLLGEDCDRVKTSPKKVKEWTDHKAKLEEQLEDDSDVIIDIKNYKDAKEKRKRLQDKVETLNKQLEKFDLAGVKSSIKELKGVISETEKKIEALQSNNSDKLITDYQDSIDEHKTELENIVSDISRLRAKQERRNKLQEEIKDISQKVRKLALKVDDLKYVVFTFSKNGIPSQEIENAFTEVQNEINFVLDQFGTSMEIIFSADRELNDWEKACVSCGFIFPKGYKKSDCQECGTPRAKKRKDELQLKVMKGGKEYGFYMESGGGKTILSLAIRVALTRLKLRKTGSEFKVLFMDEVDAPFDEENRDKFIQLVNNVLIKKLGFEQVLWVSHSKIISDAIPHTLLITKKGNYSEAEFV